MYALGDEDHAKYAAVGEADCMTLRFVRLRASGTALAWLGRMENVSKRKSRRQAKGSRRAVVVSGYVRADGTYVTGYYRAAR